MMIKMKQAVFIIFLHKLKSKKVLVDNLYSLAFIAGWDDFFQHCLKLYVQYYWWSQEQGR